MEFELAHAIEILRRTPVTLNSLLRDLPEPWIVANEGAETWSPYDVLGHLIQGEETDWIARAKLILEHGETKTFEPFDRLAMFEKSKRKSLTELLDTFAELRADNLRELQALKITPDMLDKRGRHPEFGVVTLKQLLATWVVHDLGHLRQIARAMSKQYRDAVGPWKAYLSILEE